MNAYDACRILELDFGTVTTDTVRRAYLAASVKWHPDRNTAGAYMMRLVNAAHDALKLGAAIKPAARGDQNYPAAVAAALAAVMDLAGLEIEICGAWVWVSGDTRPHKDILKASGFRWAPNKLSWYFRPAGYKSWGRGRYSMDDIRARHGSDTPARSAGGARKFAGSIA